MTRLRLMIVAIVAVAMMSFGAAACTPADQAALQTDLTTLGQGIGEIPALIAFVVELAWVGLLCGVNTPRPTCDG